VYRNGLSSFIRGLPTEVVSHESAGLRTRVSGRKWYESSAFNYQKDQKESSGLSQGDRVRHPAFGPGVVSKLIADDKVEVLFRNAGRKLLHLEYTTLEKI
jgi:DNA helicase-2/ATP-dependent DNA helicase PcrA